MIYSESLAGNASAYRCKYCSCSLCGHSIGLFGYLTIFDKSMHVRQDPEDAGVTDPFGYNKVNVG